MDMEMIRCCLLLSKVSEMRGKLCSIHLLNRFSAELSTDPRSPEFIDAIRIWLYPRLSSLPRGPRSAPRTPGSLRSRRQRYRTLDAIEDDLDYLWNLAQILMRTHGEGLLPKERGDLILLCSRLARQPLELPPSPQGQEQATNERIDGLRRLVGSRMEAMLQAMSVEAAGEPGVHEAALWIDAMALQGRLATIPPEPPLEGPNIGADPLLSRLYGLFVDPKLSSRDATTFTIRRSTFAVLLDCWARCSNGAESAANFVHGWGQQAMIEPSDMQRNGKAFGRVLRRRYGELLGQLSPSPTEWVTARYADATDLRSHSRHFAEVLATTGNPLEASRIWTSCKESPKASLADIGTMAAILEGLLQKRYLQDADRIAAELRTAVEPFTPAADLSLDQNRKLSPDLPAHAHVVQALRMLSRHAAERGDMSGVVRNTSVLRQASGRPAVAEIAARRMRAASSVGNSVETRQIFDEAIEDTSISKQSLARLYDAMAGAYVRVNNLEKASELLETQLSAGIMPPVTQVNTLLFGYAARHDVDSTYALFHRLAEGSFVVAPNESSYHALVAAHCNVRDVDSATQAIQRMQQIGLVPSQAVWTTMMNAYVELGDWRRTFELYRFLDSHSNPLYRPDTASFNVLLKASVLSSTPAQTVLRTFDNWLERGLRPNALTFTLVMHSICTAGLMDVAEELFRFIDEPSTAHILPIAMNDVKPDGFIFSTMISGYVKKGHMAKARACLSEMRRRGIEPTSVTYGIVVGSFLLRPTRLGAEQAADFARQFLASSPLDSVRHQQAAQIDRRLARGDELINILAPILNDHAKRGSARVALDTFRQILDSGASPSIELYTTLMDAYRRQQDEDVETAAADVQVVWSGLHSSVLDAFATETPEQDEHAAKGDVRRSRMRISPSQSHALCLPLSIYIDALDRAGRTTDIRRTWNELARQGFTFDAGNWNALATHFARIFELERACWIVEHVLLSPPEIVPAQDQEADTSLRLTRNFATLGRPALAAPRRSAKRARKARRPERDAHRKTPIQLADYLGSPRDSVAGAEAEVDLVDITRTSQARRLRDYWHPHDSLLAALEDGIAAMMAGKADKRTSVLRERESLQADEAQVLRDELQRTYPGTFAALRARAARQERKQMALESKA